MRNYGVSLCLPFIGLTFCEVTFIQAGFCGHPRVLAKLSPWLWPGPRPTSPWRSDTAAGLVPMSPLPWPAPKDPSQERRAASPASAQPMPMPCPGRCPGLGWGCPPDLLAVEVGQSLAPSRCFAGVSLQLPCCTEVHARPGESCQHFQPRSSLWKGDEGLMDTHTAVHLQFTCASHHVLCCSVAFFPWVPHVK